MRYDPHFRLPRRVIRELSPLRQKVVRRELRRRRSGCWGEWLRTEMPRGCGPDGWHRGVREMAVNEVFNVSIRPVDPGVLHFWIIVQSCLRPTPQEIQRIKNDLAGPSYTAFEVFPPDRDCADTMLNPTTCHLWLTQAGDAWPLSVARLPKDASQ